MRSEHMTERINAMDIRAMGRNSMPENFGRQREPRRQRELGRHRRVQCLRRERLRQCLAWSLTLAVIFCMILVCTVSYGSIRVQANTGYKYYTCITVEEGETFWSIATRYIDPDHYQDVESYIAEVENINHVDACEILLTGQRLIVPYYSSEYQ